VEFCKGLLRVAIFENNLLDDKAACMLDAMVRIQNVWDKLQKWDEKRKDLVMQVQNSTCGAEIE